MRVWDMSGTSSKNLDYSERNGDGSANDGDHEAQNDQVYPVKDVFKLIGDSDVGFNHIEMLLVCFRACS